MLPNRRGVASFPVQLGNVKRRRWGVAKVRSLRKQGSLVGECLVEVEFCLILLLLISRFGMPGFHTFVEQTEGLLIPLFAMQKLVVGCQLSRSRVSPTGRAGSF